MSMTKEDIERVLAAISTDIRCLVQDHLMMLERVMPFALAPLCPEFNPEQYHPAQHTEVKAS